MQGEMVGEWSGNRRGKEGELMGKWRDNAGGN